jgi:ribosome-interacting GTPase 1
MPTNLPPDYFAEEKRLRDAKNPDDKIAIIERMLAIVPHHKGTDHLIAQLRSRIAKLKEEKERKPQVARKLDLMYNVKKEGAGQVLFLGFPNSGKSALVGALSGEPLEVGDYPFTTRILQTRMMRYEDIWIQLVDTPALGDESQSMWFGNMLRRADVIAIALALSDGLEVEYELIIEEIKQQLPYIDFLGQARGNLPGVHREPGTLEIEPHVSLLVIVNKADLTRYAGYLEAFERKVGTTRSVVPVSATQDMNLHVVRQMLFAGLGIIRVYSKLPAKKPDLDAPFVLRKGSTTMDLALKVHKDYVSKLRFAKLWRGAEYKGMMVSKEFTLEDRDVMELHL